MREIVSSVEGKKYRMPAFSSAREILEKAGMALGTDYQENPIVATLVNGRLSPLGTQVPMSCPIEPVRAFQGFGRRVYRHSLCTAETTPPQCGDLLIQHSFSFCQG